MYKKHIFKLRVATLRLVASGTAAKPTTHGMLEEEETASAVFHAVPGAAISVLAASANPFAELYPHPAAAAAAAAAGPAPPAPAAAVGAQPAPTIEIHPPDDDGDEATSPMYEELDDPGNEGPTAATAASSATPKPHVTWSEAAWGPIEHDPRLAKNFRAPETSSQLYFRTKART